MPEFDVTFEVFCRECGNGLCNESVTGRTPGRGELFVRVGLCENCRDRIRDEAMEKGRLAGYDEGYADGFREGGYNV